MVQPDEIITRSEIRRRRVAAAIAPKTQEKLGQFFTNDAAATLIASLPRLPKSGTLRILDPGAGSGALTAALVARILSEAPGVAIEVTVVELDSSLIPTLDETLADCAAAARAIGAKFSSKTIQGDYVYLARELGPTFDICIQNPPYAKLAADDPTRLETASQSVAPPNVYAAFVALGLTNLRAGGQLVAITPRSFTNGTYFTPFRSWLLAHAAMDHIHVFGSRSSVFADTGVLQENIVYSATKAALPRQVVLSSSTDHRDDVTSRVVGFHEIVHPGDPHEYIRIPATGDDATIVQHMAALPCTLADLGVTVSTGRVVDFRSRAQLIDPPAEENYPMVYSANISHGVLLHPRSGAKVQRYSIIGPADRKWLIPAGTYLLIKRFSAKEEKRRLVAGIWDCNAQERAPVAIDNKLNYMHSAGKGLDGPMAMGLAIWLNSTLVDKYFRTFSGHTQVNATDLRGMRYPAAETLRSMGRGRSQLPDQETIDQLAAGAIKALAVAA